MDHVSCAKCSVRSPYRTHAGWLPWYTYAMLAAAGWRWTASVKGWLCSLCSLKLAADAMASLGEALKEQMDQQAAALLLDEPPPPPDPEVMEAVIETLKEPDSPV